MKKITKAANFDKKLKGISSGWVSISKDNKKVLAHAKTLEELARKIERKGNPEGFVTRVTADFSSYVG